MEGARLAEFLTHLFLGAVVGSIYSLSASGLVLTYRTSGVFNFAQGALGMLFAYVFFQLTQSGRINFVLGVYDQKWRIPTGIALVLVVGIIAPGLGWLLDTILFRKLRNAGAVVQIVATIGLLISLQGFAGVVWGAATTLTPDSIFSTEVYEVGSFRASFEEIATIVLMLVLTAGLIAFLRFSALGVRMRAVVDRPDLAELMGVNSRQVSGFAWAIATGFAALAGILVAPFYGTLDTNTLTFLVVAATAAAVVGRLESLPLSMVGALAIGAAQFLVQRYASSELSRQLRPSIPFIVLLAFLFIRREWPAVRARLTPVEEPASSKLDPATKRRRVAILFGVLLVLPLLGGWQERVLGGDWQSQIARVPPMALIFLSLVILAGYAGQISLCQAAFAGFGAFVAAHLVADEGWPFLLAVPVAGLATAPLGIALAARAARLPPLFLGFATLAFAAVMDIVAFNSAEFSGGLSGVFFERPSFLDSNRAYYIFGVVVFGIFALLANNLRRGKTGLALAAMRDSQVALASTGASVSRLRLVIFGLSAFVAGLGGAMFSAASELATPISYFSIQSLLFLALAVIGGISTWTGAIAGAAMFQLFAPLLHQPFVQNNFVGKEIFNGQLEQLLPILFGLGAIGLANNPHGVIEQTREGFAEFRAKRRGVTASSDVASAAPDGAAPDGPPPSPADDSLIAFPHARHYHLRSCPLTMGKDGRPYRPGRSRRLDACPICGPPIVEAAPARRRPLRAARET